MQKFFVMLLVSVTFVVYGSDAGRSTGRSLADEAREVALLVRKKLRKDALFMIKVFQEDVLRVEAAHIRRLLNGTADEKQYQEALEAARSGIEIGRELLNKVENSE